MPRPRLSASSILSCVLLAAALTLSAVIPVQADNLPFPEPANENAYAVPVENLRLRVWAQYRVMYNASNIPSGINNGSLPTAGSGTGKLNYGDTTSYDFFRQRMRLAFDLQHKDSSNVYTRAGHDRMTR